MKIRIITDIVIELFRTRLWFGISSEINPPIAISDDFFGINIATSDDPACDDYVIENLRQLGIQHVRMDFSYESFGGYAERLLNRVLAEGFNVLLDIFPPREEARKLTSDMESAQNWQNFVRKVFEIYHDKVAIFEIGNASNRKTWSGFQPASYLHAWQIASPLAEHYAIRLAGPNISDFEPVYNIAYLKQMRRLHSVPAIHTDNLFVERVVEPEAYDHRVIGRWAEKLLKLNLVKKARIIDSIGKHLGCTHTFATYQCWTIKRLSRWSDNPEQKQADYLSRYLILVAASDALGRVYWGPLLCSRDGIIDDVSDLNSYPEIDNVSYYRVVRGETETFRQRPAFFALQYIIANLSNANCVAGVSADNGLNHFVFITQQQQEIHIVWCRDGCVLPLLNLYPDGLQNTDLFNVLGQSLDITPLHISEQPLFIHWSQQQKAYRPEAEFIHNLPNLKLNNMMPSSSSPLPFSAFQNTDWRGAMAMDATFSLADTDDPLLPETIEQAKILQVLRDKRNKIWNVAGKKGLLTVKLNRVNKRRKIAYYFRDSKAKRHWDNAVNMLQRGINTPQPIAYFEHHHRSGIEDSYYVTEFIENAFSSRDIFASINLGESSYRGIDHAHLLKIIAEFICKMHNQAILHRDLSSGNLLLIADDNDVITPYLIDIGRARTLKSLSTRQRLIDLMRICYKLPWSGREQLMDYYQQSLGKNVAFWRLAVKFYIFKQRSKRYIKGLF